MRPLDMPLEDLLRSLRFDVQKYFLHHATRLAYCRDGQERERWVERDFYKKELSRLCGHSASEEKYDGRVFHLACVYLTRALGL